MLVMAIGNCAPDCFIYLARYTFSHYFTVLSFCLLRKKFPVKLLAVLHGQSLLFLYLLAQEAVISD